MKKTILPRRRPRFMITPTKILAFGFLAVCVNVCLIQWDVMEDVKLTPTTVWLYAVTFLMYARKML